MPIIHLLSFLGEEEICKKKDSEANIYGGSQILAAVQWSRSMHWASSTAKIYTSILIVYVFPSNNTNYIIRIFSVYLFLTTCYPNKKKKL